MTEPYRYWAFISYSRKDLKWARWLHRALERYTLPRRLAGSESRTGNVPKRIFPVFRDETDLGGASSLPASIEEALKQSRNLVVICSAHGALSKWVDREIRTFKQWGRGENVFALLVDGEPGASDDPTSEAPEAFPQALRFDVDDAGNLTSDRVEVLAVDVRDPKTNRRSALLRMVAGLIGIPYDTIVQRDRRARHWQMAQVGALAGIVFAVAGGLWWRQHEVAVHQEQLASLRRLEQTASRLVASDSNDLAGGVLLATEAVHRAVALQEPGNTALQAVRDGAALLPARVTLQLEGWSTKNARPSFSMDGRWIVAQDEQHRLLVWETRTGKQLATLGPFASALDVAFPKEPGRVAVLVPEGIEVWDVVRGKRTMLHPVPCVAKALAGQVGGVAISRDARWVACTDPESRDVQIWETATSRPLRSFEMPLEIASGLWFSADGTQILTTEGHPSNTGQAEAVLRVWDVSGGRQIAAVPHATFIENVASASGSPLVASISSNTLRLVDGKGPQGTRSIEIPALSTLATTSEATGKRSLELALSRGARWVAVCDGRETRVWHVPSLRLVARGGPKSLAGFSPNGRFLLDAEGTLWQMNSDAQLNVLLDEQPDPRGMMMADDAPVLAHGSLSGRVVVWDIDAVDLLASFDEGPMSRVTGIDRTGQRLVVTSGTSIGAASSARVWDVKLGRRLATLNVDGQIGAIAFAHDGRTLWLTFQRADGTTLAAAFETAGYKKRLEFSIGDADSLDFTSDGKELIVRSGGRSARFDAATGAALPTSSAPETMQRPAALSDGWMLDGYRATGLKTLTLLHAASQSRWPLAQGVESFVLGKDGARLATISSDGHVRVRWTYPQRAIDDACRRVSNDLTEEQRRSYLGERTGPPVCRPITLKR